MNPILEVEHLSISFTQYQTGMRQRELQVVHDLSLTIEAGSIVAVVGSSGSGKSLLAHGILGILPYNAHMAGMIRYQGKPLNPPLAGHLRGTEIVLVPQGVAYLDPLMKIGAQIRKGKKDKTALTRCRNVLNRYGLGPETENLYPFELSGGMARRVLISTAAVESPKLIVADEPTPGLDAAAAKRILTHFRELADDGAGVLLITHDLELALSVADRVTVIYAGETIENAAVTDFNNGKIYHPYTKALWNALPQNGFVPISGTQPYPGEIVSGCLFAPRCPDRTKDCQEKNIPCSPVGAGYVRCLNAKRGE